MKTQKAVIGLAIFGLGIIIISAGVSGLMISIQLNRFQQELTEQWEIYYQVDSKIKVFYDESPSIWIDLFQIMRKKEINNKTQNERVRYRFTHPGLGLASNFSRIDLYIYVERGAFFDFGRIEGIYEIENKSGTIRTETFYDQPDGMEWRIARATITSYMWKTPPPEVIFVDVIFSN